jgi:protein OS-9
MKHFWALPALLRPALVLASQHAFSVHDDILAFPQFEVHFSEDYISEEQAQLQLQGNRELNNEKPSDIDQYTGRTHNSDNGDDHHDEAAKEEKLEYEMMLHHNQRYLCSIPQVEKPVEQPRESDPASKAEQEKELARANDRGWELLAGMQGNCIYYMSGWWSYRFCYNDEVKQFHQLAPARGMPVYPPVEDPNAQGFLLGRYEEKKQNQDGSAYSEEKWEGEGALEVSEHATRKTGGHGELVTRGENRYLKSDWHGGTECDLTGKERRIEVQVRGNIPQDHPSTHTDRLNHIVPLQPFNRRRPHCPDQRNLNVRLPYGPAHTAPLQRCRLPAASERRCKQHILHPRSATR